MVAERSADGGKGQRGCGGAWKLRKQGGQCGQRNKGDTDRPKGKKQVKQTESGWQRQEAIEEKASLKNEYLEEVEAKAKAVVGQGLVAITQSHSYICLLAYIPIFGQASSGLTSVDSIIEQMPRSTANQSRVLDQLMPSLHPRQVSFASRCPFDLTAGCDPTILSVCACIVPALRRRFLLSGKDMGQHGYI